MKIKLFLSIIMVILLAACQKEELPNTGTISGTLSLYESSTPLIKTPAAGVKLWLVNYDYPMDTVTFIGNEKAIVDSTFSDANGKYSFTNVPFGNYAVSPVPDTTEYRFEPTNSEFTLPLTLSVDKPGLQLDWSSPLSGGENSGFYIYLTILNKSEATYIYTGRQWFALCIPIFEWDRGEYVSDKVENHYDYGGTLVVGSWTNNFLFNFTSDKGGLVGSYWITWPTLGSTPPKSWWTIDLKAKTITKTNEQW